MILAECPIPTGQILEALNPPRSAEYFFACTVAVPQKFKSTHDFPTRFRASCPPGERNEEVKSGSDFSIKRLRLPQRQEILLSSVHFPSKLRQTPDDQAAYVTRFADVLTKAEILAEHSRTVLVGDLNMNPYENGVVLNIGLHAVASRRIASRESRVVKFESDQFFYNPMWLHFGEKKQGHAGTYYYASPKARADFWNIYDQVLVRPSLLPYFRDEDVSVLWQDEARNVMLITSDGLPDKQAASDHLPPSVSSRHLVRHAHVRKLVAR